MDKETAPSPRRNVRQVRTSNWRCDIDAKKGVVIQRIQDDSSRGKWGELEELIRLVQGRMPGLSSVVVQFR